MVLVLLSYTVIEYIIFLQIETYIYNNAFECDNNKKVKLAGNKVMCDCNTAQHVRVSQWCGMINPHKHHSYLVVFKPVCFEHVKILYVPYLQDFWG
jgi:hypothetical protein